MGMNGGNLVDSLDSQFGYEDRSTYTENYNRKEALVQQACRGVQGRGHIIHMGVVRRGDIHHVRLGLPREMLFGKSSSRSLKRENPIRWGHELICP